MASPEGREAYSAPRPEETAGLNAVRARDMILFLPTGFARKTGATCTIDALSSRPQPIHLLSDDLECLCETAIRLIRASPCPTWQTLRVPKHPDAHTSYTPLPQSGRPVGGNYSRIFWIALKATSSASRKSGCESPTLAKLKRSNPLGPLSSLPDESVPPTDTIEQNQFVEGPGLCGDMHQFLHSTDQL